MDAMTSKIATLVVTNAKAGGVGEHEPKMSHSEMDVDVESSKKRKREDPPDVHELHRPMKRSRTIAES